MSIVVFESYCVLLLPLYLFLGDFFLIKRNMNNFTHKNALINNNYLYIKSFYNHVLAKRIIFVINSILKHLCIVRSPNSQNSNKSVTV